MRSILAQMRLWCGNFLQKLLYHVHCDDLLAAQGDGSFAPVNVNDTAASRIFQSHIALRPVSAKGNVTAATVNVDGAVAVGVVQSHVTFWAMTAQSDITVAT